jgi:hypothetical protein
MAKRQNDQQDQDNATSLTGHTTKPVVVEDPVTGKVQSRHETEVITDPDSDLAVQVPTPEENPLANASASDPLRREATPAEVFAGEADPDGETVADEDAYVSDEEGVNPAGTSAEVDQVEGQGAKVKD